MRITPDPTLLPGTAHAPLEQALRRRLERHAELGGRMGALEPLAIRLGLIQHTLRPRLRQPQHIVFAADHGLVTDLQTEGPARSSGPLVEDLLQGRLALAALSHQLGMNLTVVDAGLATSVSQFPGLMARKIAHGSRNARLSSAMTLDQLQAAVRAGMEIAEHLPGNVLGVSALGVGAEDVAVLLLSRFLNRPLQELLPTRGDARPHEQTQRVLQATLSRHAQLEDPAEVAAALGGYDIAMMAGAVLKAAQLRHVIMVDGLPACAAVMLAGHIAGPVVDYCVFCRSSDHPALDQVLEDLHSSALPAFGLQTHDGAGIALSWPLIQAAATLMTDILTPDDRDTTPGVLPDPEPAPTIQLLRAPLDAA